MSKILIERSTTEQALEQPVEQEPVSWMDTETRVLYDHDTSEVDQHHGFKPTVPIYTNPQPRQPLTDEQINNILKPLLKTVPYNWKAITRAIEAAHGIGGEK